MPEEVALKHGTRVDRAAPIAPPRELDQFYGIMFGTPTRFRSMAALATPTRRQSLSKPRAAGSGRQRLYLDRYRRGNEITITFLQTLLRHGMC
jgi:hypothetical protein